MRPHDLPTREQLGRRRPHGHMLRYLAGCRCSRCRRGNRLYKKKLDANKRRFGPNDLIPVDRVRAFLLDMQKQGIGYKTIAKAVGIGKTGLGILIWPGKETKNFIRRRTAAKVLSYVPTLDNLPKSNCVPAEETVSRIRQLEHWGHPRTLIVHEALKNASDGLQIHAAHGKGKFVVMVRTAIRIRDFFDQVVAMRDFWQEKRGPIPRRHYVYWKEGSFGTTIRSLELRPFSVTYDYHYLYPAELKEVMALTNRVKRAYRERARNAKKHDDRSSQSPVLRTRGTGGSREADGSGSRESNRDRVESHHRFREGGSAVSRGDGRDADAGVLHRAEQGVARGTEAQRQGTSSLTAEVAA
ncbi:MAG TPA: hypothetical protein VKP61_00745 [Candidatus Acidoferrum sp.]|nr:hypothetical protein [Candidatus Acidoferrum sp.]